MSNGQGLQVLLMRGHAVFPMSSTPYIGGYNTVPIARSDLSGPSRNYEAALFFLLSSVLTVGVLKPARYCWGKRGLGRVSSVLNHLDNGKSKERSNEALKPTLILKHYITCCRCLPPAPAPPPASLHCQALSLHKTSPHRITSN
jgi:hypothetical protein